MSLFGTPVRRVEDQGLLTGNARYVGNIDLDGAAHVAYVTSPAAHARVVGIDLDEARSLSGVLRVVTAGDLTIGPYPPVSPDYPAAMTRPLLAADKVVFVGQALVAVVAETAAAAAPT